MKRYAAVMLVFSLLAPHASLNAAQGSAVDRTPAYWYAYASKLPIGATVRVRTVDGKRLTAVLAVVDPDAITLEPNTRIPEPARRLTYNEIQQLELRQNGVSVGKAVAIGVGAGAGLFFALLAAVASNWD